MKRVVHLLVELPDVDATEEQIEEYIEFEVEYGCQLSKNNPLRRALEVKECYIEDKDVIC